MMAHPIVVIVVDDHAGLLKSGGAVSAPRHRNEAMDAGCIAYLGKPFAQHVLLNAISKAVALADAAKTKSA
jgi:AmiR/NasT family two-component response regulator